jgi:L-ascorbate metabolism protein UlaG (beta-lactamase superfamily)
MAAKFYFNGHGSFRLTSADGKVIYIDPYAGDGYDKPADMVLVTHQHDDHNQLRLISQKEGCRVISNVEALEGGKHNTFTVGDIGIEAVEAANKNHDPSQCVGFVVTMDGLKLYFPGDTSKTASMESLAAKGLDYAVFPCDGIYNMDLDEAAECARLVGAKHNIPVHMKPGELFDRERAEMFDAPNRLIIAAGEEIELQ